MIQDNRTNDNGSDDFERKKRVQFLLQRFFEDRMTREEAAELLEYWNATPGMEAEAKRHFLVDRTLRLMHDKETTLSEEQFDRLKILARSRFNGPCSKPVGRPSRFNRPMMIVASSLLTLSTLVVVAICLTCLPMKDVFTELSNESRLGTIFEKSEEGICVWSEHSSGLKPDGSVIPGEIELLVGIAQIYFDNGAVVTFEGPTRLTLHSDEHCTLHSGRVYARISPEAIGFTIETPLAEIKDLGTEFGIELRDGEEAQVQVFSGRVDVLPKNQKDFIPITTGGWLRFEKEASGPVEPNKEIFEEKNSCSEIVCSTADGNGREACILSGGDVARLQPQLISRSGIFTLVKHSHETMPEWHRKGYFSIDLSRLPDLSYQDVQLELAFAPTGVGFLSFAPEVSTFSIYGLTDESLDDWTEEMIAWDNAPANLPDPTGIDLSKAVKVGSFEIPRNEEACRKIIATDELRDFLAHDTNRIVTFIVVRETLESARMGYAHGFANRHHPELPPPTLRFFNIVE